MVRVGMVDKYGAFAAAARAGEAYKPPAASGSDAGTSTSAHSSIIRNGKHAVPDIEANARQ